MNSPNLTQKERSDPFVIVDIHQEIKLQMRWSFGVLIAMGGLVVGILRMAG